MTAKMLEPANKIEKLDKELESEDISRKKALKIIDEREELREELEKNEEEMSPKLQEYVENELSGTSIPFKVEPEVDECTIESIKIHKMKGTWLNLSVYLELLNPTEEFLKNWEGFKVYFKFEDKKGNKLFIEGCILNSRNYTEGETSQTFISLSLNDLYKTGDFAKVIVTSAKYR